MSLGMPLEVSLSLALQSGQCAATHNQMCLHWGRVPLEDVS